VSWRHKAVRAGIPGETAKGCNPRLDPGTPAGGDVDATEMVIVPRARDLGGSEVRRALTAPERQMSGPFILFDQFGSTRFLSGQGLDVRPHPHIGLATVTHPW
jgi:hypothetical protein